MDEAKAEKAKLEKIAQMMFDHKMDNLSKEEQALFAINPTDLPFVFISLDKIKNQVSFVKKFLDFQ